MAGAFCLNPLLANAGVITHYDIDFSSPAHTAGMAPSTGTDTNQVSSVVFGTPTVTNNFAGTANQSLHFNANTSTYEQIRLDMGQGYDNYQVSFDFFSSNLAGSDYAFTLLADTPQVRNFYFHGSSGIRYWGSVDGYINGGQFANNTSYNVLLDYDLAQSTVSIWLNGGLMGTNLFTTSGDDIESLRFSLSPWIGGAGLNPYIDVGLDNILVTSRTPDTEDVPEPNVLLLMFLGLSGLVSIRKITG